MARPSWTDVRIDGMDANDPVFGDSPAGASGLFLGLNEFAEVRLLTQTFNVEYGKPPKVQMMGGKKITFGVEAYNLFNRPNFGVPSNTQSALSLGGNGDAIFKDAADDVADNVGRIFTTVGSARQIQLAARFSF
jgi:hypothetical protein